MRFVRNEYGLWEVQFRLWMRVDCINMSSWVWHFGQHLQGCLVPSQAFLFPIGSRQPLDLKSDSVHRLTLNRVNKRNQVFQNSDLGDPKAMRMTTSTACLYKASLQSFCNCLACKRRRTFEPSSWHLAETPLSCEIRERVVARCLSNATRYYLSIQVVFET